MTVSVRTSVLVLALAAAPLLAQQPVALDTGKALPPASATQTTEPHLTLDVVVTDKSGKPISGLQGSDFSVLDNKQPTPITSFRAVSGTTAATDPLQLILVIDEVNTGFQRVAYVRDNVRKFLQENEGHIGHPTSIMFFTDTGTDVVENKDGNGMMLADAVQHHASQLRTIRRSQGIYGADDRLGLSLHTLSSIAAREEAIPGRKLIVWISPGWPYLSGPGIVLSGHQQDGIFASVIQTQALLRRARVTLSSVDPIGAGANVLRTSYYEEFLKGINNPGEAQIADLSLQVLASQSGGRVLTGSNDTAGQIAKAASDADAYYVLTVDTKPADKPNELHLLQVRTEKGVGTVRTRDGYYAQP